jgi:hypothetical protein
MKKTAIVLGAALILLLAVSPVAMATNGNGPDYDTCPKDFMDAVDVARFEEIIDNYKAAIAELRGNPDAFDQRLELKEAKRDALLELVPTGFEDRFGNFNTEPQQMRRGGSKNNGN